MSDIWAEILKTRLARRAEIKAHVAASIAEHEAHKPSSGPVKAEKAPKVSVEPQPEIVAEKAVETAPEAPETPVVEAEAAPVKKTSKKAAVETVEVDETVAEG